MPLSYSLSEIQSEVGHLLRQGAIDRRQPIYTLSRYIPPRDWTLVECELEKNDFLLRDRIGDLVPFEEWGND
ncbi:MAG: DUF4327 family protein [Leptolyngbyaceae cyanobacterium bins.59]|nr:DUF4327 family protein [Leptolyngbyaceae cyanobacterium bins.59]